MDHVKCRKQNSWKNKMRFLLLVILFVVSGILLLGNYLLFSDSILESNSLSELAILSYNENNENYAPVDENAVLLYNFNGVVANGIKLSFKSGLEEDTVFTLVDTSNEGTQNVIEEKVVRKGYQKVNFYFENKYLNSVRIYAKSNSTNYPVNIPNGTINIIEREVNLIHNDIVYYVTIAIIFIVACILATLICGKEDFVYPESNARTLRESNLELLRIICMLALVAHHFAVHGGLLNLEFSVPKYVGLLFLPIGKISFIAFIAISMYFLVDGKNKVQRFIKCWLEVLFYSVSLTILAWCLGGNIRIRDFVSCFFVMTGNSHGFAASYLLFLLLYPFILIATRNINKKQSRYLLVVVFNIQIVSQILKVWTGYTQPVFSELTLFIFCYILSMNLKRYPNALLENKFVDLGIIVLVYAYVMIINLLAYKGKTNSILGFLCGITGDESSIFYIIAGYALFYFFKNIRIPHSNLVNNVAAGTFGILLIHDHNFLRHLFWNDIIKTQTFYHSELFILYFAVVVCAIFIVCSAIDYIRRKLLEPLIINTSLYKQISIKMDSILCYNDK